MLTALIWKRWNVAIFWVERSVKQELLGTEALRHLALIDCKYPLWCKFSCSAKSSPGSVSSQNFPAKIHPRANILSHDTRALSRISTWLISPNDGCQADVYSGNTRLSGKYAIPTEGKQAGKAAIKCKFLFHVSSPAIVPDKFRRLLPHDVDKSQLASSLSLNSLSQNQVIRPNPPSHSRNEHLAGILFVSQHPLLCSPKRPTSRKGVGVEAGVGARKYLQDMDWS